VVLALTDSPQAQLGILVTSVPALCLLSVVTALLGLVLPWIAPALTAASIVRERELGTLDLLRATLLTERSIVVGKLGGCLARLWPGILTLALLTPFQLFRVAGGGLFLGLPALTVDPVSGWPWGWLILTGVVGLLRPWGDLALHAAVGLFVSPLARSSSVAIAVSYGAIIVARMTFWLANSLLGPALFMFLADPIDLTAGSLDTALLMPGLTSLAVVLVEFAGAALLVAGAVWRLKRM
jgi:hypothetical protein